MTAAPTETVQIEDPAKVHISTLNTRQPSPKDPKVIELGESMASPVGQISPCIVRPHPDKKKRDKGEFELAAGARRKVAATLKNLQLSIIVRDIPDSEFEDMILVDNLQRDDPDPMQEAILIERRLAEKVPENEICAKYGKDRTWLRRRVKLLALTKKARAMWATGKNLAHFTTEMMEFVATMPPKEQDELAGDGWETARYRSLEHLLAAARRESRTLEGVPWLQDEATFVEGCGPGCATNSADGLFPDPSNKCGACQNRDCFFKREGLYRDAMVKKAIGDHKITDLIIFDTKAYTSEYPFQGKNLRCLRYYETKERYTVHKKQQAGTVPGLNVTNPLNPRVEWLEPKDKKAQQTLAAGGTISKGNGKQEDPKDRLTGKRLAALNAIITLKLRAAPIPLKPTLLTLVAAFGCKGARNGDKYFKPTTDPWDTIDNGKIGKALTGDRDKGVPIEEIVWLAVREVIVTRLEFEKNATLLSKERQAEMRRIAGLIGVDYDAEFTRICTTEVLVPKSWGPGFDPVTLKKTTAKAASTPATPPPKKAPAAAKKAPTKKAAKKKPKATAKA